MELCESKGAKIVAIYPMKVTEKGENTFRELRLTIATEGISYNGMPFTKRVCVTAKGQMVNHVINSALSIGDVVNAKYMTTSRQYTKQATGEVNEISETILSYLEVVSSAKPTPAPAPTPTPQPTAQASPVNDDPNDPLNW